MKGCRECFADEGEECICESLCEECGGTGIVDVATVDADGEPDWDSTQCEVCNGDGQRRAAA